MKVNYDGHEHEHEFEPEYGLPEPLPAGERVLWQGSPDWRVLARRVFHVRALMLYFIVILIVRALVVTMSGGTMAEALRAVVMLSPLAALAIAVAVGMALLCARTTVYTITDKRVTMRIGIVLNLTFNLPFARIATAGLRDTDQGTGDIPLTLVGADRIAYLHLWPHARPWCITNPEPMLRGVRDVASVAQVLSTAWHAARGIDASTVESDVPVATREAALPPSASRSVKSGKRWLADGHADQMTQGA